VEDYVETFFNQLKDAGREQFTGAFLVGEHVRIEDQECVYVTGAVQMKELDPERRESAIGPEHLEMGKAESREYFRGQEIVGWFLVVPEGAVGLTDAMTRVHEKLFPKKNSLFILKDTEEDEQYFAYKFHELMQIGGHYIFYEKNPDMQSYMISERRQIGVTPSEVVEDRAAKDFRNTIRGQMQRKEQRRESRYVYLTSVLLVIVVLAIGISTMNNYDKMNSVQTSIETLSSAMQQSLGKEDQPDGESEENTSETLQAKEALQSQDDQEQADDTQTQDAQMEPAVSTIQEELSEDDYYIVEKGDTLDTISRKIYGTSTETDAICEINGLEDGNLIFIGQKLLLP
jgi:LysM repeat protein